VDVEFPDYESVFPKERTQQHLSCYNGIATTEGAGVKIETLAWNEQDVMALHITDQRERPGAISINLRMLRSPVERRFAHTAASRFETNGANLILTQRFAEDDYYCGSAVVVGVSGRNAVIRESNERELSLVVAPQRGSFTVWIASAASFQTNESVAASALEQLKAAANKGYAALAESNRKSWQDFWRRSFVRLHSEDGVADEIEQYYTYYLYLMAATSRGEFPTKFNGMLWTTGGDRRQWGGQYWGANQSCLYNNALFAANHTELLDPHFDMLSSMLEACSRAAREQWGSQGAFYPETVFFDGLAPLPDDIAAEMRDLYLLKKPWVERSPKFLDYAGTKIAYSSRWNWIGGGGWTNGHWTITERGGGPYGPVTHIFSRGAKYAYQFWLRYEYTQDETWLRNRAYPIMRAVAEFYRNYPNVKKGEDGKYHIHDVNSNESVQGAQDTDEEIASMLGLFPVLLKASNALNADAEMRPVWQEFLTNLAPLPHSDSPRAARNTNQPPREPTWIRGYPPVLRGSASGRPDGNTMPQWFFDLCTLESDAEILKIGNATLGDTSRRGAGVLSKIPLVAAIMGRTDAVRTLIPSQLRNPDRSPILANRMDLREGAQATSAQRLGNAADALHTALCYDLPAGPGQPSVIRVFAAWPKEWDAEFTLLCRGGFLVTSAMRKSEIEFVEIHSQLGGECWLRNPWGEGEVTLFLNGLQTEKLVGSLLKFSTAKGEVIVICERGETLQQFKRRL
jgi:hypothetical protein